VHYYSGKHGAQKNFQGADATEAAAGICPAAAAARNPSTAGTATAAFLSGIWDF